METNDVSKDLSAGVLAHSRAKTEVLQWLLNYSEYVQRLVYGSAVDDIISNLGFLNDKLKGAALPLCVIPSYSSIVQSDEQENGDPDSDSSARLHEREYVKTGSYPHPRGKHFP